ncbi:DUF1937 family protein [Desulfovibrio subterraneus]|uniref:DUF1937 domain-containing protein n=1 Tax=Desulfovibrio subterraneus TaxID=2718620 RepID=A0A7J0BLW6_9BACT|nr:DUF1937 family protein [Desulfovibrio subterraneus]GFM34054.1 hypothetical protein DSM101010T_24190 [Desulfovibrio subterraneus]
MSNGIVLVYLAAPYTHESERVRQARFLAVTEQAARGWEQGYGVYSPLTLTHEAAVRFGLPKDWAFWAAMCRATLERHHELWVLCLPGWRESVGVQAEIAIARALGLPVRYIEPESAMRCATCPYAIECYDPIARPCGWIGCPYSEGGQAK